MLYLCFEDDLPMKKYLLLLFVLLYSTAHAQLSITTNFREDGIFDEAKSEWTISESVEGSTKFQFDKNLTSVTHVTESDSSEYEIVNWEYNEKESLYEMKLQNGNGNSCDFLVDGINKHIMYFYSYNGKYRMIRYRISDSIFKE